MAVNQTAKLKDGSGNLIPAYIPLKIPTKPFLVDAQAPKLIDQTVGDVTQNGSFILTFDKAMKLGFNGNIFIKKRTVNSVGDTGQVVETINVAILNQARKISFSKDKKQ